MTRLLSGKPFAAKPQSAKAIYGSFLHRYLSSVLAQELCHEAGIDGERLHSGIDGRGSSCPRRSFLQNGHFYKGRNFLPCIKLYRHPPRGICGGSLTMYSTGADHLNPTPPCPPPVGAFLCGEKYPDQDPSEIFSDLRRIVQTALERILKNTICSWPR